MSRLIPDSAAASRPFSFTESELDFLLGRPELLALLRRAGSAEAAPFRRCVGELLNARAISPELAAKLRATFRHRYRHLALAAYRKKYPKRVIITAGSFADEV